MPDNEKIKMTKVKCEKCHKELRKPGALIFSPLSFIAGVSKFHICCSCYSKLCKKKAQASVRARYANYGGHGKVEFA